MVSPIQRAPSPAANPRSSPIEKSRPTGIGVTRFAEPTAMPCAKTLFKAPCDPAVLGPRGARNHTLLFASARHPGGEMQLLRCDRARYQSARLIELLQLLEAAAVRGLPGDDPCESLMRSPLRCRQHDRTC